MNKKYVEFVNISEEQKAKIFSLAKGCFQKSFLEGKETYSLSTLRGKAKDYKFSYMRSRDSLFANISNAGFIVAVVDDGPYKIVRIVYPDATYMLENY